MSTYLVMAPPGRTEPAASPEAADRLIFLPDRFSWFAFLFSALYLLWHRLWLPFAAYLAVAVALEVVALEVGGLGPGAAAFLIAALLGFEATNLRRWMMERNGWVQVGLACGDDLAEAELRFFHTRTGSKPNTPAAPPARASGIVPKIGTGHVVGLTFGQETQR